MSKDVKLELDDEPVVKTKTPPPAIMYMRWSKVLNKWVPCLESDHEAIPYRLWDLTSVPKK